MNSSSTVTRVATHFAIGSVSEVTTGTISRFAGGMINTGDVGESLRQAFDPKSMLLDAARGGATNSVQGFRAPKTNAQLLPDQVQQIEIVSSVEDVNNPMHLENNMQKGNYCEMKMDIEFESNGCKRISTNRVTGLDDTTHHGIDGVYESSNPPPKYIIAEAKYGSSKLNKLKTGERQMSNIWIQKNLNKAVGPEIAREIRKEMLINPDNVQSVLVRVDKEGNILKTILEDGVPLTK